MANMKYIIFQTSFGPVAAVKTAKGLRRLYFGYGSFPALRKKIAEEFPCAVPDAHAHFSKLISSLKSYLAGSGMSSIPSLDMEWATDFQKKIYSVLRKTRPGTTITYSELARAAGVAGAARAAGSAMRKNQIPLVIPCHRVILSNGHIGNFSAPGGPLLKKKLLFLEAKS